MVVPANYSIELSNVSVPFNQDKEDYWALKHINLKINNGDRIILIGLNGSGKSTLLKVLCNRVDYSGQIIPQGLEQLGEWKEINDQIISHVPQDIGDAIGKNISVSELLSLVPEKNLNEIFDEKLKDWIKNNKKMLIRELSGGQRQLIVSAIAISNHSLLLFFDEVFRSLDLNIAESYRELIARVNKMKNNITINISHDPQFIFPISNRVVALKRGSIVFDSPLTQETLKEACCAAYSLD